MIPLTRYRGRFDAVTFCLTMLLLATKIGKNDEYLRPS